MYQLPKTGGLSRVSPGNVGKSKVFPEDHEPWRKRILDPGSEIVLKWNHIFLISCLVALFIDPLYFYLPSVDNSNNTSCIKLDHSLSIVVTVFRTLADLFYMLHIAIKFRTAYVAPSSRVFGRGELVMDPKKIRMKYLKTDFFVDLAAALPLPQVTLKLCFDDLNNVLLFWENNISHGLHNHTLHPAPQPQPPQKSYL